MRCIYRKYLILMIEHEVLPKAFILIIIANTFVYITIYAFSSMFLRKKMFNWFDFIIYAVVTAITPGPNNIMSMSNASVLGFTKALPFNFGIFTGFCFVITLCTIFSSLLASLIPVVELPMLVLGAAYILYLAWKTFKNSSLIEERKGSSNFIAGMTLQFINPKFYIYCIVSMDAYILPYYGDNVWALVLFAFLLCFIGFACTLLWSAFGTLFKCLFSDYAKITNTIMSLLLVYCAASLLLSHKLL